MRPPLVSMAETAAPSATDDAAVRRYSVGRKLATTQANTEGEAVQASAVSQIFSSSDLNAARAEAAANEQLLVVKFFAPWCRSCKSIQAKFSKLARSTPQHSFAEVNWVASRSLCKKLGIKILPYMEIVAGKKGKIDSFTCGPSKISMLVGKLEDTATAYCGMDDVECTDISHLLPPDD